MRATPRPQQIGLLSVAFLAAVGLALIWMSEMGAPAPGTGGPLQGTVETLAPLSLDAEPLGDLGLEPGSSGSSGASFADVTRPLGSGSDAARRALDRKAVGFAEFRTSLSVTDAVSGLPIVGATVTEVYVSSSANVPSGGEPLPPDTGWLAAAADDRGLIELVCRVPDSQFDSLNRTEAPFGFDVRVEAGGYVGAMATEVEAQLEVDDRASAALEMARDAGPVRDVALYAAGSLVLDVLGAPPSATGRLVLWSASSARGRRPHLEFDWPLDAAQAEAGGVTLLPSAGGSQRLVFQDLPPGSLSVALALVGAPVALQQALTLRPGQQLEQLLRVTTGEVLSGIVRDIQTKAPVQGVTVVLEPGVEGLAARLDRLPYPPQVTDERGAFSFAGLPQGEIEMELHTVDGAKHPRTARVVKGNIARRHELYVRGAASLSGRVEAPTGLSLAGVQVLVTTAEAASSVRALGGGLAVGDEFGRGSLAVVDPATGRFTAEAVPSGRNLVVHAMATDSAYTAVSVLRLKLNESRDGVEVVLEPRPRVSFRVESASGEAVTSLSVRFRGLVEAKSRFGKKRPVFRWSPKETLDVQADGLFSVASVMGLPDKIRVAWDDRVNVVFDWPDGDVEAIPTFEIVPAPIVLVEVRGSDGVAVPQARVRATLSPSVPSSAPPSRGTKLTSTTHTDSFGRARLRLPLAEDGSVPGPYDLNVAAKGYSSSVGLVVDEDDALSPHGLEVVLERKDLVERATITGRLVRGNGEALIDPRFDGLRRGAAHVDGHSFELRGIAPGRVKVVVHCKYFESQSLKPVVLRPGESLDVGEIVMRPATLLTVTVKDSQDKLIKNAVVQLVRLPAARSGREGLPRRIKFPGEPAPNGAYKQFNIPRARWRLVVKRRGYKTYQRDIRLSQTVQRVNVVLVSNR